MQFSRHVFASSKSANLEIHGSALYLLNYHVLGRNEVGMNGFAVRPK